MTEIPTKAVAFGFFGGASGLLDVWLVEKRDVTLKTIIAKCIITSKTTFPT